MSDTMTLKAGDGDTVSDPITGTANTADEPDTQTNGIAQLPKTMKAATVVEFNKPLQILDDVAVPVPEGPQILIKIHACSLCMSDLAGHMGALGLPLPYCAGHEPVGEIVKLSSTGSPGFAVGDRVCFMPASTSCQNCHLCLSGNHRFCPSRFNVGFSKSYGGFSEYSLADPMSTCKIPDGLSYDEAAPLSCAGVTAYGAVKKASRLQPGGSLINVVGSGGVGHLVIQYAKKMGFDVQAFDVAADKLQLALDCGADVALDSSKPETATSAKQADTTIVVSSAGAAYDFAFKVTRDKGRVIAIGVPHHPIPIEIATLVLRNIDIISTNQGTKQELNESLQLAADKGIKPIFERRHISQINEGVQDMLAGKINGRLVYHY